MNSYLVVYYSGSVPTFAYAETLEEARSSALNLLNTHHGKHDDILSIVNVIDDSVIYYGKRDKLLAEFTDLAYPTAVTGSSWPSLRPILNWIGLKLARLTTG